MTLGPGLHCSSAAESMAQTGVIPILPGWFSEGFRVCYIWPIIILFILFFPVLVIKHRVLCILASATSPSASVLVTLTLPEACPSHPLQELQFPLGTHYFANVLPELG